jgi:hypothetical protein
MEYEPAVKWSESDHSALSKDYDQMMWSKQLEAAGKNIPPAINTAVLKPQLLSVQCPSFDNDTHYQTRPSFDSSCSIPSPVFTDFQTESPMFRNASPFSPWSAGDEFLGPTHTLDLTAYYMRQQQQYQSMPRSAPMDGSIGGQIIGLEPGMLRAMQLNDGLNFADGTIRPNMLDCNSGIDLGDQMDNIILGADYENGIRLT